MRIDSARLAYELVRRDWKHKKLAEMSGVSRATISAISSGKKVSLDTSKKIAAALDVPIETLLKEPAL